MMRDLDDSNEHEVWNDTSLSHWSIARLSGDVAAIRSREERFSPGDSRRCPLVRLEFSEDSLPRLRSSE
jgi:hypothetical protein